MDSSISGDWERLVRGVIQEFEENNSGVDLFHFDSDEDVFCVYSQYIDDLMLLSKMIRAACDNEKTMGMYLNMSEAAGQNSSVRNPSLIFSRREMA